MTSPFPASLSLSQLLRTQPTTSAACRSTSARSKRREGSQFLFLCMNRRPCRQKSWPRAQPSCCPAARRMWILRRYGQEAVKECAAKDPAREATDDLLLRNAFAQAKPILGICYGLQSLNVWRRGSLIQDLPHASEAVAPGAGSIVNHEPGREVQNAHPVLVTPGSRLSNLSRERMARKSCGFL